MSQFDELAVPTNIPDELWQDINRVRTALVTFAYYARMSVEAKELRTGEYDLEFYRWLEPLVDTANQIRNIKRHAPWDRRDHSVPEESGRDGINLITPA